MKITQDELKRLIELNAERNPLQEKLEETAERAFAVWNKLNPCKPSLKRQFRTATATDAGVVVGYEEYCCCLSDEYTTMFSFEMLTSVE
ncbi:MAG: hypothetical protein K2Y22_06190 [Candidatus Obscuribacterales bacterium]|nr:hypothetical protein [Candidatus Obscuribacterales bacterium]